MNIHSNARLTPIGRAQMVRRVLEEGLTLKAAAAAFNVSPKTASKWVRHPRRTAPQDHQEALPQVDLPAHRNPAQALQGDGEPRATPSRPRAPGAPRPARSPAAIRARGARRAAAHRHQEARQDRAPGQAGHRQGQPIEPGWEFLHVCIDDHSRIAYAEILEESASAFLQRAVVFYDNLGITTQGVMTDNGSCYVSKTFSNACEVLSVRHLRTRPYTPQTNGKAERFIQSALREWAYARAYRVSTERTESLPRWLHSYNWHRPHSSIKDSPPISRLKLDRNNLLTLHS